MTPASRTGSQTAASAQTGYREPLILFLLFAIVLGLMVFWFVHSLKTWRASQVEHLLIRDLPVPVETLTETLAQSWNLDQTLMPGMHLHTPALLAASLIAAQDNGATLNRELMLRARESTRHALCREPANTSAWARLSFFRYFLDGSSTEVVEALRLSIYTAPADPYLIFWRLGLAAHNHAFWNDQMADSMAAALSGCKD